jgi:chromosome segregation ATPase
MDMRSKLIGLALFGLFAAALVWGAFSLRQAARRTEQDLGALLPEAQSKPRAARSLADASLSRSESTSQGRIEALRTQVERLSARIGQLSKQLEQKNKEYDALKGSLQRNNELLMEIFTSNEDYGGLLAEVISKDPSVAATEAEESTVSELKNELRQARAELAELETEAAASGLRILELEERQERFEALAGLALLEAGAVAVPSLIELLSDPRAEIRRWSAMLLGDMGRDAEPAVEALQEALADSNETVRSAARKALNQIAD